MENNKKSGAFVVAVSSEGETLCAASGRISTKEGSALDILELSGDKEKNARLITKVVASGHTSTTEHLFFSLAFENVSVVVEQFMIEFRLASFTVKSRRYVDFSDSGYHVPASLDEEDKKAYRSVMDSCFETYAYLQQAGVPKEDCRFVLPYCFFSNFYCSLNGREMCAVLRAMLYGRGSRIAEIRAIGEDLLRQCAEIAPGVFSDFERRFSSYRDELDIDIPSGTSDEPQNVRIIAGTPDPSGVIVRSSLCGRYALSEEDAAAMAADGKKRSAILAAAVNSDRGRELESCSYTVRYSGVSLSTLTHFARHRMQTLILAPLDRCRRDKYIIPPSVAGDKALLDRYISCFDAAAALDTRLRRGGYGESETVYTLLSGNTIDIVSVMNVRELKLFFALRCCSRAQWEVRELATELLRQLRHVDGELFSYFGPSCVISHCPEGRLSCGKAAQMKEFFGSLR